MNKNIFDPNHTERWYLLIENVDYKPVVRAAGSLEHVQKFDPADGTRYIIKYESAKFLG